MISDYTLALRDVHVRVGHHARQLAETGLGFPAELPLRLARIAEKEIHRFVARGGKIIGSLVGKKGDILCTVESVKSTNDLSTPLTGVVQEVNTAVTAQPEIVNKDPYGEGWLLTLRTEQPGEAGALLDWEAYRALIS